MAVIEIAKIQVRRGQENQTGVPQLEAGEFGWAQDTEHLYIGKRISEGANTDENTRILTENDLQNIFNLVDTTSTQIINYTYRESVPHITNTVPISLQDRLDQRVSLESFGVVPSFTPTDITVPFKNAIDTLYYNSTFNSDYRTEAKRKLIIPAGNYFVRQEILLPPFAQIEGEGPGITKITLIEPDTHLFRTVDAIDKLSSLQQMSDGINRSRNISLSNMSLEYATTASSDFALLSLNNVFNANIENVEFSTNIENITFSVTASTTAYFIDEISTATLNLIRGNTYYFEVDSPGHPFYIRSLPGTNSTYNFNTGTFYNGTETGIVVFTVPQNAPSQLVYVSGNDPLLSGSINISTSLVGDGIGIQMRGTKNAGVELCDNIQILNCRFDRLKIGIESTGSVTRMVIKDSLFKDLESGIRFFNVDEFDTPSKGIVTNNKFENIVKEALYVGTDTTATHHISQYNIFYQVGNGLTLDDNTSTEQYAVINFNSDGNKSIDDYFSRQNEAITNTDPNFYYNPLVVGAVSVINNTVFKYNNILPGVTDLTKIPLTDSEQRLEIEYKFYDDAHQYNRTGKLLINISKGAEVAIEFTATTALLSGVSTLPLSALDYDVSVIQVGATIEGPGIQPLTTVTTVGVSTIDISLPTTAPIAQDDLFTITQFSQSYGLVSDYYNFSYEASWPHNDPDEAVFLVSDPVNNYVTLTFTNWTGVVNFNMEYQFSRNT